MTLPAPAPRKPLHTRKISFEGFLRDDGLWDIDAELVDTKTYPMHMRQGRSLEPGDPIHHMRIRVTVDDALKITDIATAMNSAPFPECQWAADPMKKLIGVTLGAGWRKAIESAIGGVGGCTHLRELLFNVATAAFQTIPTYRDQQREARGEVQKAGSAPPYYLGKCKAWDFDGPVVERVMPLFYRWRPPAPAKP